MLARQACYQVNPAHNPFWLQLFFRQGFMILPRLASDCNSPTIPSMQVGPQAHATTSDLLVEVSSC
jgi:hypothetical protein